MGFVLILKGISFTFKGFLWFRLMFILIGFVVIFLKVHIFFTGVRLVPMQQDSC